MMAFCVIALLDFTTPPAYILAYLYLIPILISVSFLNPRIAKLMLVLAIFATLLNLVFPRNVLNYPAVVTSRLLAALAIFISAFFMVRYIRYHQQLKTQEHLLLIERNMAQMREDFIATLTHDLKTPLIGGQQTLTYMRDGQFGPLTPEQTEVIEALLRSHQRQLDLVQSLVSSYRIDNMGMNIEPALIDMDELIADSLTEIQYLALERGISIHYLCSQTPPSIQGDPFQLKRVLSNLLHNALNYAPAFTELQVKLTEQPGQILVTISDQGPGIPPDDLEKVFLRFYRSGDARQVVSTGLGLYLSRQIILAHRGAIWAENVAPTGCQFSFTLPTVPENGSTGAGLEKQEEANLT